MNLVYLNIGGRLFLTSSDNFSLYPNSLLGKMFSSENRELLSNEKYIDDIPVYYFDRNPKIFQYILDIYRSNITYKPENINRHIYWKELKYWGFEFEKPSNVSDDIWSGIKETAEKLSQCLMEPMYPEIFICPQIEYSKKFLIKHENKLGDVDESFSDVIVNIIRYKKRDKMFLGEKEIKNGKEDKNNRENDKIREESDETTENEDVYNDNLDIKELKEEINEVLHEIYFRNNTLFNNVFTDLFEKYVEFYLSTMHGLQLKIKFSTVKEYNYTGSYIENDIIYFGINHNYLHNVGNEKIKTYQVEPISFY